MQQMARSTFFLVVLGFAVLVACTLPSTFDQEANKEAASLRAFVAKINRQKKSTFRLPVSDSFISKALLGKYLFFDNKLSVNGIKSCASCHSPKLAFTDGYRKSLGTFADVQNRNSPTLLNVAKQKTFNWANPNITSIAQQIKGPLFAQHPVEMGADNSNDLRIFEKDERYQSLLKNAYGPTASFSWEKIIDCLSSFCQTIVTATEDDPEYAYIDEYERTGQRLFFSDSLKCGQCHSGENFNLPKNAANQFANTGLYADNAIKDSGVFYVTRNQADIGKFRVPSLWNLASTAPYMHDGSLQDLEAVIEFYASGGSRQATNKNPLMTGFVLSEKEKKALIRYLLSIEDNSWQNNIFFTDPFDSTAAEMR
jgi:cytochrome c peroxidase